MRLKLKYAACTFIDPRNTAIPSGKLCKLMPATHRKEWTFLDRITRWPYKYPKNKGKINFKNEITQTMHGICFQFILLHGTIYPFFVLECLILAKSGDDPWFIYKGHYLY